MLRPVEPELTIQEVNKMVEPIIREYLEHGDTDEVVVRNNKSSETFVKN